MVRLGVILRWVVSDHEFQPLHRPQPALERFSGLDDVEHVGVVERLRRQGGVVGGRVEEGGFGEVGKHCERHSASWGVLSVGTYRCWCGCRPFPVLWEIAIVSRPKVAPAPSLVSSSRLICTESRWPKHMNNQRVHFVGLI